MQDKTHSRAARLSDFTVGQEFTTAGGRFRVTDIGSRTLVAIRIDQVQASKGVIDGARAEAEGWFRGPPYAVAEIVFDEDDFEAIETIRASA